MLLVLSQNSQVTALVVEAENSSPLPCGLTLTVTIAAEARRGAAASRLRLSSTIANPRRAVQAIEGLERYRYMVVVFLSVSVIMRQFSMWRSAPGWLCQPGM